LQRQTLSLYLACASPFSGFSLSISRKTAEAMLKSIVGESSFGKYDFMYLRIVSSSKDHPLVDAWAEVIQLLLPADGTPWTIVIGKVV
jgi:hypothetical protein